MFKKWIESRKEKKKLKELDRLKKAELDHWELLTYYELEYSVSYAFSLRRFTSDVIVFVYINRYRNSIDLKIEGQSENRIKTPSVQKLIAILNEPARSNFIELMRKNNIKTIHY